MGNSHSSWEQNLHKSRVISSFFYLLYLYHIKMGPFPTQQTSFYIDLENFFYAFIDLFLIFMGFIE